MSELKTPLRLSILAIAARRAIGGPMVERAAARPSEAVPAVAKRPRAKRPALVASKRPTAAAWRRDRRGQQADSPDAVVPRSAFGAPVVMPAELRELFGPAPARLPPPAAPGEGRERVTDEARIATLWRRGMPLRELRGEYGATADAVVRTLLPALNWQRAA